MKLLFIVLPISIFIQTNAMAKAVIRGTGPIHVKCVDASGVESLYNVNKLLYSGNGDKRLAAIGFGPNRQDDGLEVLKGSCVIVPNQSEP